MAVSLATGVASREGSCGQPRGLDLRSPGAPMTDQIPSHQTVRLSRGRHKSVAEGACVMELASMLAGEAFTDDPRSVSPVIADFLRTYNDLLDDDRRQDLYRYAAEVVGTRARRRVERRRARECRRWACAAVERSLRGPWGRRVWTVLRLVPRCDTAAKTAAYTAVWSAEPDDDAAHLAALELIERLISMSDDEPTASRQPAADYAEDASAAALAETGS